MGKVAVHISTLRFFDPFTKFFFPDIFGNIAYKVSLLLPA